MVSLRITSGQVRWPGSIRPMHADRDQGLQADDAERGLVELAHLLLGGVRGMVGGEDLDRAVLQAADDGLDVGLRCAAAGSS